MQVMTPDQVVPENCRGAVVAIGNFDGVHLGHQTLISITRSEAEKSGRPLGVLTFEPHPRSLFRPDEPVFRLSPREMKSRLLKGLGVDFVDIAEFNRDLASLEAQEFVEQVLVQRLGVSHVVTGYDFHFGRGRKGSPEIMRQLGEKLGFGVSIVDQVTDDDGVAPYSSSAIRTALRRGHVRKAAEQLGYWWSVHSTVVEGDRRGRTIGYPTANIALEPGCEPHEGIYAVRVRVEGDDTLHHGAGYIGYRPTFETDRLFLEVFIFDFDRDIYGKAITVQFNGFIRPDKKFDNLDGLLTQMKHDCDKAKKILAQLDNTDSLTSHPLGALQAKGRL